MVAAYGDRISSGDPQARGEGKLVHKASADLLLGFGKASESYLQLTGSMKNTVGIYTSDIRSAISNDAKLEVECKRTFPDIHPLMEGTPDARMLTGNTLIVWELKNGVVPVYAEDNRQMLIYCSDIFVSFPEVQYFQLRVVQPNRYDGKPAVIHFTYTREEIQGHLESLRIAAHAAYETPRPGTTPGNHCGDCPGRASCQSGAEFSTYSALSVLSVRDPTPAEMAAEIAWLREAQEAIKNRLTGLEALAISKNVFLPGFEISAAPGKVVWDREKEHVIAAGRFHGIDLSKPGVSTPKQAEALGLPSSVVRKMSRQTAGTPKLKPVDLTLAKKVFNYE